VLEVFVLQAETSYSLPRLVNIDNKYTNLPVSNALNILSLEDKYFWREVNRPPAGILPVVRSIFLQKSSTKPTAPQNLPIKGYRRTGSSYWSRTRGGAHPFK
jgi:hypothetical protein